MLTLQAPELLLLLLGLGFAAAFIGAIVAIARATTTDNNEELLLMCDMTDSQMMLFQSQMLASRKSPVTGVLLTLFLGGLGVYRFYLGQIRLGILYLVFVWTTIPGFIAFIVVVFIAGRVRRFNLDKARNPAIQIKALRSNPASA